MRIPALLGCALAAAAADVASEAPALVLHVVAPVYREYAALGTLVHAMLSQTDPRWTLTVVSDGPDPRVEALLTAWGGVDLSSPPPAPPPASGSHGGAGGSYRDRRLRYLHTPSRTNDGGHSPRALGLALAADLEVGSDGKTSVGSGAGPQGSWMVLSGCDNYYAPIFVAAVLGAISADTGGGVGLVYWDFVLDYKSNDDMKQSMRRAAAVEAAAVEAAATTRTPWDTRMSLMVSVGSSGRVEQLRFGLDRDAWFGLAFAFATAHGLTEGGGCEAGSASGLTGGGEGSGPACVAALLVSSMGEELDRAAARKSLGAGQVDDVGAWYDRLPGRYEGHVSAALAQGRIDVGAFAFPTAIGREVGFHGRHHSADWAFLQALLSEVAGRRNLTATHLKQTLYVHN